MNQAGKGHAPRPVNGEVFRNNHDDIFRKEAKSFKCPHCGSDKDPFFSRVEPMGDYCPDCGKNVDE
jgi:predicted RNA-binding Zn-ribbon protein involved in translation (DUF1610 family)